MRIGIVAIEASGDSLGAELMRRLTTTFPDASFVGCGGDLMQKEGLELLCHIHELEAIGLAEVVKRLIPLIRIRRRITHEFINRKLDLFIGVDGPDFNGHLEKKLSRAGIPCAHYVCPTIWAWRKKRAKFFSRVNQKILCLYPLEQQMIEEAGGSASFVGHPLAHAIPLEHSHIAARQSLQLDDWITGRKVIGILPGSRSSEILRLLPEFIAAAKIMTQRQPLVFLVSAINEQKNQLIEKLMVQHAQGLEVKLIVGQMQNLIAASDVVMTASGTASLETLLINRPMIIAYKVNWLSFWILRWLISQQQRCLLDGKPIVVDGGLPLMGLPNLLGGGRLVPEFLQYQVQPQAMAESCLQLLTNDCSKLRTHFHKIHVRLQNNTTTSAANVITSLLLQKS